MTALNLPILVIAYAEDVRANLVSVLNSNGVVAIACSTFCEAENLALQEQYTGMLVDLASIIKAKGEEKIVAYTLASFFPTLRVRSFGSALVPMAMPGSAKQDKSLNDFLNTTCTLFEPRKLRAYRRHPASLSLLLRTNESESRGFTLNLSWNGAFIVNFAAESFVEGQVLDISFPEFNMVVSAEVRWIMAWGKRCAPGIGVRFFELCEEFETILSGILKSRKEFDRDRLLA